MIQVPFQISMKNKIQRHVSSWLESSYKWDRLSSCYCQPILPSCFALSVIFGCASLSALHLICLICQSPFLFMTGLLNTSYPLLETDGAWFSDSILWNWFFGGGYGRIKTHWRGNSFIHEAYFFCGAAFNFLLPTPLGINNALWRIRFSLLHLLQQLHLINNI